MTFHPVVYDPARTAPYTPAEVCVIARNAYAFGVDRVGGYIRSGGIGGNWPGTIALRSEADKLYPAPLVERPRVVTDESGIQYCVRARHLDNLPLIHYRQDDGQEWRTAVNFAVDAERAALFADLFANPTEQVPA